MASILYLWNLWQEFLDLRLAVELNMAQLKVNEVVTAKYCIIAICR